MKISVNLATRPFIELRPLFARLRLSMAALALLAIGLAAGLHVQRAKAAVAEAQMDSLKNETAGYQNQLATSESRMRQPQNRAVLDRAQFLNHLFASKSFSWTAVMMDLETVLPAGVQVTSIEPQITKQGDVNIRMRVNGERDRAVELVRNLEQSKRFLAPHLTTEALMTAQGTGSHAETPTIPGGVEFDILSGYNPLPLSQESEKHKAEKGAATTGAATGRKPSLPKAGRHKPAPTTGFTTGPTSAPKPGPKRAANPAPVPVPPGHAHGGTR